MIRFGDTNSIPELKKLWKECFADEDTYIDAFFEALYEDQNVLLEEENGVLMGASFFLPGEIYLDQKLHADDLQEYSGIQGGWQEIRYVYALAVYPQFRGRGIAGSLLRRAYKIYGAPLIAEPAEEGLVEGFYRPLGFSEDFYLEKKWLEVPQYDVRAAEILPGLVFQLMGQGFSKSEAADRLQPEDTYIFPAKPEEYCRIRDSYFRKHGYVRWPAKHVAFAIQEHCSSGGGAYAFHKNGKEDILLYYREGQDVIVTETTLTEKEVMDMVFPQISGLCSRLILIGAAKQPDNASEVVQKGQDRSVQEKIGVWMTKQRECLTGMSYGLPSAYGYLNLTLD